MVNLNIFQLFQVIFIKMNSKYFITTMIIINVSKISANIIITINNLIVKLTGDILMVELIISTSLLATNVQLLNIYILKWDSSPRSSCKFKLTLNSQCFSDITFLK